MITCNVCGHINDSARATCEECGSDLSDSPDWGNDYDDDLNFDELMNSDTQIPISMTRRIHADRINFRYSHYQKKRSAA